MKLIDPAKVLTMIPAGDCRLDVACAGGLIVGAGAGLIRSPGFLSGNSDIGAVRCAIANAFYKSDFEWLITIDSDIGFSLEDLRILMSVDDGHEATRNEAGEEIAVTCEYSKKNDEGTPVRFGMGFCRFHKSVFQRLDAMTDEGSGQSLLAKFYAEGALQTEFFPMGVTGDSRRLGEDTYFWSLVRAAGITPRIETRTRLTHWGRKSYPYIPDMGSGAN